MMILHHAPRLFLVAGLALALGACGGTPSDLVASETLSRSATDRRASTPPSDASSTTAPKDAAQTDPPAQNETSPDAGEGLTVRVYDVKARSFDEAVQITGELRANEEVELRAEEDGRVVGLYFDEGERVRAGELLVKINDADLQAERRRIEVQRQLAAQREERTRTLLAEKTISQELYDEANGRLQVLDAELELIAARIDRTEIHAPFAGVVGLRQVSEGSYLTSSRAVATLQSLDPIKIDFAVPEKYAADVGPGATVELDVAGQAESFTGRVYAVEPRIDAATRTVQVRAQAPNPQRRLLPGAFVKVRLVLESSDDAVLVPSIALIPGLEATTVYVAEDGHAQPRRVKVGRRTADRVQILEGIKPGRSCCNPDTITRSPGSMPS
ncbi:MAG: efflux RND transporter periplasmic adaptor subunit, partial [Acidobacteriota bacterium]